MTKDEIKAAFADGSIDKVRKHGVCIVCDKPYEGNRRVRVCSQKCKNVVNVCRFRAKRGANLEAIGKRCRPNPADSKPPRPKKVPHVLRAVSPDTQDPWMANYGGGWVNADPVLGF